MKKIVLSIAIIIFCLNLNGQVTESSNGNVGIGDIAPTFKLDVKTGVTLENGFNVSSNSSDGGKIYTTYESGRAGLNFVENDDPFVFNFLQTGFNLQLGFHHGKMGIGTASPRAMLHVNNGDNSYGSILANANEANFSLYTKTLKTQPANIESFRLGMKYDTNENNGFISFYRGSNSGDGYLGFSTSGKERIRIDKAGNVGVGTATPGAKFDVKGGLIAGDGNWGVITVNGKEKNDWAFNAHSDGKSFHIRTQTNTSTANSRIIMSMDRLTGNVGVNNLTPKSKFHVRTGTSGAKPHGYSDLTIEDSSHGMISVLTPNNKKGYFGFADPEDDYVGGMEYEHAEDRLIFRTNNHAYDLVLNKDGNLGIGTTNTKGFKLGVNGKIAATEVKVATYSNWADFVFKKDYNLPTLSEVENHIKENGHLANIPSAAKVKKDGFFLGEMDAKLLQKIEELTLYTIQQEKDLKNQEKELEKTNSNNLKLLSVIEKLEKRIEKLESK